MIIYNYISIYIYTHVYQNYDCISIIMSIDEYPDLLRRFSGLSELRQGHFTVVDMGGNIALHNAKYNRLSEVEAAAER